jgi:hypothetical protein
LKLWGKIAAAACLFGVLYKTYGGQTDTKITEAALYIKDISSSQSVEVIDTTQVTNAKNIYSTATATILTPYVFV